MGIDPQANIDAASDMMDTDSNTTFAMVSSNPVFFLQALR